MASRALRLDTSGLPRGIDAARSLASRERHRRRAVLLCHVFILLLPLEGILRKWVMSDYGAPIGFIRDPVAVGIAVSYLLYRAPRVPLWLPLWLTAVLLALLVAIAQSISRDYPLPVYLVGLRNHFLFIPMAMAMADIFRTEDLRRLVMLFCYLSVPIAILVAIQFYSLPGSFINKGLSDDPDARVFLVTADIVRPYGPFTFVLGQSTFAALLLAVIIAGLDRMRQWSIPLGLLLAGLAGVIVMGVLSGSRTLFLSTALIGFAYLAGGLLNRRIDAALRRMMATLAAGLAFILVLVFVFPTALDAITTRQEQAVASEGATQDRILVMLTPIPVTGPELSAFGEGLGLGSNAGGILATGSEGFQLSEYEMPRLFQECGILLGGLLLALRLALTATGMARAIANARRFSSGAGFAMVGFVGQTVFLLAMSGQNTAISIAWLGIGLMLAMSRADAQRGLDGPLRTRRGTAA